MSTTHTNFNPVTHSRSSSASSHRVPVPPLIPIPHSLHGIDVFSPFISSSSSLPHSYNEKIEAASAAMNASFNSAQNNSSNHEKVLNNQSEPTIVSSVTPVRDIFSPNVTHTPELSQCGSPSDLSTSSPAYNISQKPFQATAPQRLHFVLPSLPAEAYHTRIPSLRNNSSSPFNQRTGQHYRVHSAGSDGHHSEKATPKNHYTRSTFVNQNIAVPFRKASDENSFLESFLGILEAFGALIINWYSCLVHILLSWWQALCVKLVDLRFRSQHRKCAAFASEVLRSKLNDSIEESYVPVPLPASLAVRIKTSDCGEVEIEFGMMDGERGIEIPYQIYRKTGDIDAIIKADILYLQDSPFTSSNIPPFVAAFIRDGYRLIIPYLNMANSGSLFGSAGQSTDIGRKARLAADVLQQVKTKDAADRAANFKVKIENEQIAIRKAAQEKMTEAEKIKQAASGSADPALVGQTLRGPAHGPLFDLDVIQAHRPTFLLGLGHSALVALTYPIENMSPSGFPYQTSPSAFSFPSLSMRAEPSETLLTKLNSFRGSISSGLSGTGWWARDPNGDGRPKAHTRSNFKDHKSAQAVNVCGIIAIGPTLDPNLAVKSSNVLMRFSRRPSQSPRGVGPTTYLPSIKSAIERLHLNAHKIRIPVLIAHGTKEAYSCIAGINSLYESLSSPDCTLIFCPTLRHNADLATDAARNGLATESLAWMSQRLTPDQINNKVKLLGQGAGANHKGLPVPYQPAIGLRASGTNPLTSCKLTSLEAIPESIQDRFETPTKTSSETERSHHVGCSSALSQNIQSVLSNTADDGFLEELREEPKNRASDLMGLGVSFPSRSPSPSRSSYESTRHSTHGSVGSTHSRTSSYTISQHAKPSFDSSRRDSNELLNLPSTHDHYISSSRSHSPSGSSVVSSPGPLTPQSDTFSVSENLHPMATEGGSPETNHKQRLSNGNGTSNTIITRPNIDSLYIDIPGAKLGINY
ncbi:hypothetical protein CROQUDRAFT_714777 [Cronartium quercuum f. sp. fusiforme G11]|uniref:Serine aminopeptidase S33 domain-containing protein n=1 Tax=Cronartium quercuum f. sp. fusiforme G11 TaxID=708437 RepID=A0A9P6NJ16_9BASI|nr:hypothetical protein CROQUDRAFT_714777 [Cronartium quercuum f. sp. fusiforme G11]